MKYELKYGNGLAELRCDASFTTLDAVPALEEIRDAPWRPQMTSLLIVDEHSSFNPGPAQVRQMSQLLSALLERPDVHIAVVVSKVVHVGIGNMVAAFAGGGGRFKLFMSEEDAREWLGSEQPPRRSAD